MAWKYGDLKALNSTNCTTVGTRVRRRGTGKGRDECIGHAQGRRGKGSFVVSLGGEGGVVTIYTNHPGGNIAIKKKTIKFDVLRERPATQRIQIS